MGDYVKSHGNFIFSNWKTAHKSDFSFCRGVIPERIFSLLAENIRLGNRNDFINHWRKEQEGHKQKRPA
ncbi:hypothetical protein HBH1_00883 [Herbaspirillum sp. BH-1]|nr:hypothetical protein HBH1_00883 [Herbaspirillum sp. BH-1]